jgi:hypothetical protein
MIASLFRKSTPINYTLVVLGAAVVFFLYQVNNGTTADSMTAIGVKLGLLAFIYGSLFISNFIVKKNGLSKDSCYTILFYLLFMLFFPSVLDNPNVLMANFFILLALRRLISLHSPKSTKEKIFDASLWIFVAALFHFWCIIFIVLVFISILFHVSRDYRNWILPFFAGFSIASAFLLFAVVFDQTLIADMKAKMYTNFRIDYFTNNKENLALAVYAAVALFFMVSMIFSLSNRPQILQSSYKKIIASFFIAIMIFVMSAQKSNDLLLFSIATSHIELPQERMKQEIALALTIVCSLFLFFSQL